MSFRTLRPTLRRTTAAWAGLACAAAGVWAVAAGPDAPGPDARGPNPAGSRAVPAQAAPVAIDPATRSRRIMAEEQRQAYVGQRVDDVVLRFRELVADLRSNGLLDEGQGNELVKAVESLGKLNARHVNAAMGHLRDARKAKDAPKTHLEAADGQIDIVVRDLTELLKLAKALEAQAMLRQELRLVIQTEERLHESSKDVGRQALEGKLKGDQAVRDLVFGQKEVAVRAERLPALFQEAIAAAADADEKTRFTAAAKAFKQRRVEGRLKSAASGLEARSFVEAVTDQKEALDDLRAIEAMLDPKVEETPTPETQSPLAEAKELVEQIAELEKRQMEIREETQKQVPEKKPEMKPEAKPEMKPEAKPEMKPESMFDAKASMETAKKQEQLKKDTAAVAEQPAAQNPEIQKALQMAQKAMAQAAEMLNKNDPEGAVPPEMAAEKALAEARKAAEKQVAMLEMQAAAAEAQNAAEKLIAEQMAVMMATQMAPTNKAAMMQAKPQEAIAMAAKAAAMAAKPAAPEAAEAFEKAAMAAEMAAEALMAGDKPAAMEAQAKALEALQMAAQAAAEAQQPPTPGEGKPMAGAMPGMPGMTPGMMPGMMPGMAEAPSTQDSPADNQTKGDPQEEANRTFSKTGVSGTAAKADKSTWQSLGKRERDALGQKYSRELPPEYRELLKDYYKALSK